MRTLVGKNVHITEVRFPLGPGNTPSEVEYAGRVEQVDGHMIKVIECRITCQYGGYPHPGTRWFNTMASTFKSVDE